MGQIIALVIFTIGVIALVAMIIWQERNLDKLKEEQVHAWNFVETSPLVNDEVRAFAHSQVVSLVGFPSYSEKEEEQEE